MLSFTLTPSAVQGLDMRIMALTTVMVRRPEAVVVVGTRSQLKALGLASRRSKREVSLPSSAHTIDLTTPPPIVALVHISKEKGPELHRGKFAKDRRAERPVWHHLNKTGFLVLDDGGAFLDHLMLLSSFESRRREHRTLSV
jgi:hypothetical protein